MKQIINSILDTDLYKFTMQNFVLQHYPEVEVVYEFKNRNKKMKFTGEAVNEINNQIKLMGNLKLKDGEYNWLVKSLPFMPITYFEYLKNFRFNVDDVSCYLDEDELVLRFSGKWRDKILWEVPLMAIISEVYFTLVDTNWTMDGQEDLAFNKADNLSINGCKFADFGTRRRRSFDTHEIVIKEMKDSKGFIGTSNVYFAMKYDLKPIGTCAHEAIGAVAALESLNHPNKVFMEKWTETYKGRLGIMLPDTYGHESFFKDFDVEKAKLWDGLRHDSGEPEDFANEVIDHYLTLGINPKSKTIVFSDSLDVMKTIDLHNKFSDRINCTFGIGTHFTNHFIDSPALNMVIKLIEANGVPVVKLGAGNGKENGDKNMINVMNYIHKGIGYNITI